MSSATAQVPTMTPRAEELIADLGPAVASSQTEYAPAPHLLLDRAALKALMKEAVFEVFQERREEIAVFLMETYEDACLGAAMEEEMEGELADPKEVEVLLDSFR